MSDAATTPSRAEQADAKEPHWIVVGLSKRDAVMEGGRPFTHFFRHASQVAANAECERLAARYPGRRFAVYGSGVSFKVEKPAPDAAGADAAAEAVSS